MAIVTGITTIGIFLLSKPISAYQMGESYAKNMGLNVQMFRVVLVMLSSVLSACVTAFAGPVSFVGIAVPHLVKSLFRTAKPILMIPACFLGGAILLSVLRPAGKNLVCTDGIVHQYCDGSIRRSGGYLYYDPPEERKGGVGSWKSFIFIPKD